MPRCATKRAGSATIPRPSSRWHAENWGLRSPAKSSSRSRTSNSRDFVGDEAQFLSDLFLDRLECRRVVLQELLDVLAALTQTLAAEREPRAALLDDLLVDRQIEQVALARDALAVHHVELGFAEGRRDLVLDDLDPRAASNDDVAVLDGADAADVDADRGVELQ